MREKEIHRSVELTKSCLEEVKQFISEDVNLRNMKFEDDFLLRFVRGRKYNSKNAFKTIHQYYLVRRETYPDIFDNLNATGKEHVFDSTIFGFLKQRDLKGRKVFFGRSEPWDVETIPFDDLLGSAILLTDEAIKSEETQENGIVLVFDYKGFNFSQMRAITLGQVRKVVSIFMKGCPCKVKEIYCVNVSRLFYWSTNILKIVCPSKIQKRVVIDSGVESLHLDMSPDTLPDWLGGSLSYSDSTDLDLLQSIYENKSMTIENKS